MVVGRYYYEGGLCHVTVNVLAIIKLFLSWRDMGGEWVKRNDEGRKEERTDGRKEGSNPIGYKCHRGFVWTMAVDVL